MEAFKVVCHGCRKLSWMAASWSNLATATLSQPVAYKAKALLNLSPSAPRAVVWDMVPAAECAARERACGRVLCWERGGAEGAAGTGRLVPLRLEAANEVRLYPIEDDSSEMDS
jgi:hypothetical protein